MVSVVVKHIIHFILIVLVWAGGDYSRFPLGLTGLIFLQSKRLSRVLSNTTVQKHQFFGPLPRPQAAAPPAEGWGGESEK